MLTVPYTPGLHPITNRTWAYMQPPGTWGYSNCGLVVSGTEALLVDTQFTKPLTHQLLRSIATAVPDTTITTIINTHANGDHCWGNELLPSAIVVGARSTSEGIADELSPAQLEAIMTNVPAGTPLGQYMRRYFAEFDFSDITVIPPTQTFDGELDLCIGSRQIRLLEVGPAHTRGDTVVHIPDDNVLFAGDILFIGDHPIMWAGPISNWINACTTIIDTGATVFVPGHGPVTDRAGVAVFRDYLEYVQQQAQGEYQAGTPYWQAASHMRLPEEYASWGHPERLVITVASIYRDLGLPHPPETVEMLSRMAEVALADHQ